MDHATPYSNLHGGGAARRSDLPLPAELETGVPRPRRHGLYQLHSLYRYLQLRTQPRALVQRDREQRETCGHLAHSQQLDKLLEFEVMIKGYLNTLIHVLI